MALKRDPIAHEYAPVVIRPIRKPDLCACHRIERHAVMQEYRWDEKEWHDSVDVFPTWVAVQGTAVVGYIVSDLRPKCVDILKIAVNPKNWRQGIGALLAGSAVDIAKVHRRKFTQAMVPLTLAILPTLQFFRALGWLGYLSNFGDCVTFIREVKS